MLETAMTRMFEELSQLHPHLKCEPTFGLNSLSLDYYDSLDKKHSSSPTTRTYKYIFIVFYNSLREICLTDNRTSMHGDGRVYISVSDPELKEKCVKHIKEQLCLIYVDKVTSEVCASLIDQPYIIQKRAADFYQCIKIYSGLTCLRQLVFKENDISLFSYDMEIKVNLRISYADPDLKQKCINFLLNK